MKISNLFEGDIDRSRSPNPNKERFRQQDDFGEEKSGVTKVRLGTTLSEVQRIYITNTLQRHGFDKKKTCSVLKINQAYLTRKLNQYGMEE